MTIRAEITIDDTEAIAGFDTLIGKVANMEAMMDDIGAGLVVSAQKRIEDEEAPDGSKWPELATSTRKKRGQSAKMLRDSNMLYGSLTHMATAQEARYGSNKAYARIQNLGGMAGPGQQVEIPARTFLGVSKDDEAMIFDVARDHFLTGL